MTIEIKGFKGKFAFLSNFQGPGFTYQNVWYPTNEHFYQAMKTHDVDMRKKIALAPTAGEAKKLGQQVDLRDNWEKIKFAAMYHGLTLKFSTQADGNNAARKQLIDTDIDYLEETNVWNDQVWGVCNGVGENHLGQLLMTLRTVLQQELVESAKKNDAN